MTGLEGKRILCVDDEPANLQLLERVFRRAQADVRTAADAGAALDLLGQFEPDIVVTDLRLPDLQGKDLALRIRASRQMQNVPIVAITAYDDPVARAEALAAGCSGYLTKPIDVRTITAQLASFLPGQPGASPPPPPTSEEVQSLRRMGGDLVDRLYANISELRAKNSELSALQDRLVEARTRSALGEMAAGIVHEFRNPLSSISGLAGVVAQDLAIAGRDTKFADLIRDQVSRLERLCTQLLGFARPETPRTEQFDIADWLGREIERLRPGFPARWTPQSPVIPGKMLLVQGDVHHLAQIVLNLVRNAFDAVEDGGDVLIALEALDGTARLTVQDTGCGIEPSAREKLFQPFFSTKGGNGTGLGLAVCKQLADRNNWELSAESEPRRLDRPGSGWTRFTLSLPLMQLPRQGARHE